MNPFSLLKDKLLIQDKSYYIVHCLGLHCLWSIRTSWNSKHVMMRKTTGFRDKCFNRGISNCQQSYLFRLILINNNMWSLVGAKMFWIFNNSQSRIGKECWFFRMLYVCFLGVLNYSDTYLKYMNTFFMVSFQFSLSYSAR